MRAVFCRQNVFFIESMWQARFQTITRNNTTKIHSPWMDTIIEPCFSYIIGNTHPPRKHRILK